MTDEPHERTIVLTDIEILSIPYIHGEVLRKTACQCRVIACKAESPKPGRFFKVIHLIIKCQWCRILARHNLRFPAVFRRDERQQRIEITASVL